MCVRMHKVSIFDKGENLMKNMVKIAAGTALTTILTVFALGVINGSSSKQYTSEDIPVIGWALKVSNAAGKTIGEKMRTPEPNPILDSN